MSRKQLLATAMALAVIAAVAGAFLAGRLDAPGRPEHARVLATPRPVPAVPAIDHRGQSFSRADLEGHWSLVFFGFTYCPDICPATLHVLSQARQLLADLPPADRPAILMVSVDPERDSPERLAEYVPFYDPEIRGLHVAARHLPELTRAFGVAYAFAPLGEEDYTVDHTASLFVVNRRAEVAAVFPTPPQARQIAADMRRIIQLENPR
jgi:protein SCO1